MVRPLTEYPIMLQGASIDKVRDLHDLTGEFKDNFLGNHDLQDLLLNGGYEVPEDSRPKSFKSYQSGVNGMKVGGHLMFLDYLINLATKPEPLILVSYSPLILPGQTDELTIETPSGMDPLALETFQTRWMQEHKSRDLVRGYQEALGLALDEYSMQFILNRMGSQRDAFLPNEPAFEPVRGFQERIRGTFEPSAYHVLDNAYYNMGNRFFRACRMPWEALAADEFGKDFILDAELENQMLRTWQRASMYE